MKEGHTAIGRLTAAYALGMTVVFPWLMRGYLDIAAFKLGTFLVFTLLFLLLANLFGKIPKAARPQARTGWMVGWVVLAGISTLLSPKPGDALWGIGGYMGGWMLCAASLIAYLGIGWWLPAGVLPWLQRGFIISGVGVGLLGTANNFGLDPLGVYAVIDQSQRNIFFSTIGNVDYLNSFFCLWLPLAIWLFLENRSRTDMVIGGVGAALGFVCLAALDPGIASLGMVFAFLVLLWAYPLKNAQWARLFLLAAFWAGGQWMVESLQRSHALRMVERPFSVLGRPEAAGPLILLCAAAAFLLQKKQWTPGLLFQRVAAGTGVAAVIGIFIWRNLFAQTAALGGFDNLFLLGPEWATGRGAIFADAVWLYRAAPPLRKLLGYGMGAVFRLMEQAGPLLPYPLNDVIGMHNEYLDTALCFGLLGLAAWAGVLISHLRQALRNDRCMGWVLAVCAYAGQAFFNNRVSAVFPILIVLLAILRREESESEWSAKGFAACMLGGMAGLCASVLAVSVLIPVR